MLMIWGWAFPSGALGRTTPELPSYFHVVKIADASFDRWKIVAFEQHATFDYLVAEGASGKKSPRYWRRCLLLKPATLIVDDLLRDIEGSGQRTLHQLIVNPDGGTSLSGSRSIDSSSRERVTIEAGQYTYQLELPPVDRAAGFLSVLKNSEALLPRRLLPSGVLPFGPEGSSMLERWDSAYRTPGRAPWDTGRVSEPLMLAVKSGSLSPCRAVVLGCGSGTNAVYLAEQGFEVTGIDIAPTGLSLAADKARQAKVDVRWILADVTAPPDLGSFDFVFDRGCYHGVRQQNAEGYVAALAKLTRPGSQVLILAGNAKDQRRGGPPKVTEDQIRGDFQKHFVISELKETRFGGADADAQGALAWAISLRRKEEADTGADQDGFLALFPKDGEPEGWLVRTWNDLSQPAEEGVKWIVRDGILHGSLQRGTWLVSEREYDDFVLKFEFKLGERGNSGCAIRAPMHGDPAFDGMELQMADFRYNTEAKDSELTGGIYRAIAPKEQVYKPTEWNQYDITLRGSRLQVRLNGVEIHDLDLDQQDQVVKRHDGTDAPAVKDRPRRGHIGFQELSRNGSHVQIRNAKIRVLGQ
jgi:SAM-dependent methyltransferase